MDLPDDSWTLRHSKHWLWSRRRVQQHYQMLQQKWKCKPITVIFTLEFNKTDKLTFTFDVEPKGAVEVKLSRCVYWRENFKCTSPFWPLEGRTEPDRFNKFLLSRYQQSSMYNLWQEPETMRPKQHLNIWGFLCAASICLISGAEWKTLDCWGW